MLRTHLLITVALAGMAASTAGAEGLPPVAKTPDMPQLDTNGNGGIDVIEARFAAHSLWNRISPDWWFQTEVLHDAEATLKNYELVGRLEGDDYVVINANADHGIEMKEWSHAVETRLAEADNNQDGRVDPTEFGTEAGLRLLQLLE